MNIAIALLAPIGLIVLALIVHAVNRAERYMRFKLGYSMETAWIVSNIIALVVIIIFFTMCYFIGQTVL